MASSQMADTAKQHAESLIQNPDEPLSPPKAGVFWGQNIFEYEAEGYGEISDEEAAQEAIQYWYEDGANYNAANPSETEGGRNFSQLIWRASKKMGMGVARKADEGSTSILVLAYYDPAGNFKGQFEANVVVSGNITATLPMEESSSTQMQIQQSSSLVTTAATNQNTTSSSSLSTATTTENQSDDRSTSSAASSEKKIVAIKADQQQVTTTGQGTTNEDDENLVQVANSAATVRTTTKTTKTTKTTTMITGGSTTMTVDGQTVTQPNVASSVVSTTETKIDGRTGGSGSTSGTQKITTVTTRTTVQGSVGGLSGALGGQDLLSMISNLVKSTTSGSSGKTTKTTTTITATIKGVGVGGATTGGGGQDLAAALREALACSGFTVEEEDEEGSEVTENLAICDGSSSAGQDEVRSSVKGTLTSSEAGQASTPIVEEPAETAAEAERRQKLAENAQSQKVEEPPVVSSETKEEPPAPEPAPAPEPPAPAAAPPVQAEDKKPEPEPVTSESQKEVVPAVQPEVVTVSEVKEPEVMPEPEPEPEPEVPAEPKIEPTLAPMTEEAIDLAAKLHNEIRGRHGAPSVKIIDTLCEVAQGFAVSIMAKKLEDECTEGSCTGLNVYHFKGPEAQQEMDQLAVIRSAIKNWMTTIETYNWRDPMASGAASQEFAQFVWAKSRSVGFGLASNGIGSEAVYVVVYAPPADYSTVKLFRANVRPDLS